MDGINLSQSMQESKKGTTKTEAFLDKGVTVVFVLFLVVAAGWGGLVWYVGTIDQKIAAANVSLTDGVASLTGKKADRAGDFSDRSSIIRKSLAKAVDPDKELGEMEKMTVPGVVLTGYRYDRDEKSVSVIGTTDNFKFVAQQLLTLKVSGKFDAPKVMSLTRMKDGKIEFAIEAGLLAAAPVSAPLQ